MGNAGQGVRFNIAHNLSVLSCVNPISLALVPGRGGRNCSGPVKDLFEIGILMAAASNDAPYLTLSHFQQLLVKAAENCTCDLGVNALRIIGGNKTR